LSSQSIQTIRQKSIAHKDLLSEAINQIQLQSPD
jgi:hypothetical protein